MFSFLKNYKLNRFLADSLVTVYPEMRMFFQKVETMFGKVLGLGSNQGAENFKKFIKEIYEQKDERIRLKMLMLLHFLMKKERGYCELFIENYRTDFGGKVGSYTNKSSSYVYPRETMKSYASIMTMKEVDLVTESNIISHESSYNSLHNYIYLHIVIPYHSYLIRFASSQDRYQACLTHLQTPCSHYDSNQCWKLLNVLKLVSNLKTPLNHLGRYYKDQVGSITDFIQIISSDLIVYKYELQKQIHFALNNYWEFSRIELEALVLQVDEVFHENENLYEIFKNKYFNDVVHRIPPNWFVVEEGVMETVEGYLKQFMEFPIGNEDDGIKESYVTTTSSRTTMS